MKYLLAFLTLLFGRSYASAASAAPVEHAPQIGFKRYIKIEHVLPVFRNNAWQYNRSVGLGLSGRFSYCSHLLELAHSVICHPSCTSTVTEASYHFNPSWAFGFYLGGGVKVKNNIHSSSNMIGYGTKVDFPVTLGYNLGNHYLQVQLYDNALAASTGIGF